MSNDRWKSILVVIADPFAQQQPALTKAVAEHVIDRVDCDVLVIKPAGFKAPTTRPIARTGILPRSKMTATRRRSKRSVAVDMS